MKDVERIKLAVLKVFTRINWGGEGVNGGEIVVGDKSVC